MPFGSVPLWSAPLYYSEIFSVCQLSQRDVFMERDIALPESVGSWLIWTELPILDPDLFVIMKVKTPNPHSLISPKGTLLIY